MHILGSVATSCSAGTASLVALSPPPRVTARSASSLTAVSQRGSGSCRIGMRAINCFVCDSHGVVAVAIGQRLLPPLAIAVAALPTAAAGAARRARCVACVLTALWAWAPAVCALSGPISWWQSSRLPWMLLLLPLALALTTTAAPAASAPAAGGIAAIACCALSSRRFCHCNVGLHLMRCMRHNKWRC
jgi:hypothetical protein